MAHTLVMPKLGLTMETGTVVNWLKSPGDTVEKGDPVVLIETDKIVNEVTSPYSGTLLKIMFGEGDEANVQAPLAYIGEPGEKLEDSDTSIAVSASTDSLRSEQLNTAGRGSLRRVSPRARKLMEDLGIEEDQLPETGKRRISESDVRTFMQGRETESYQAKGSMEAVSNAQQLVAARMTESFRDIPQFSLRFEVDMDHALAVLQVVRSQDSGKVSVNHLLLRATALALSRYPKMQRQYREEGLWRPAIINLGFAVAVEDALQVPVIRRADTKRVTEIAREATGLVDRAKSGRLTHEDTQGATFTVTNLGPYGIVSFTPIINPGEAGILSVGAVRRRPKVVGQKVTTGKSVELTAVSDHRAVNGAIAATFCRLLKEIIEQEAPDSW